MPIHSLIRGWSVKGRRIIHTAKFPLLIVVVISLLVCGTELLLNIAQGQHNAQLDAHRISDDIRANRVSRVYTQRSNNTLYAYFFYSDRTPSSLPKDVEYVDTVVEGTIPNNIDITSWLAPYGANLNGIPVYSLEPSISGTRKDFALRIIKEILLILVMGYGTYRIATTVLDKLHGSSVKALHRRWKSDTR